MTINNGAEHPIQAAIRIVGSQNKLARALDIYQTTISKWIHFKRPVAAHLVIKIEQLTNGVVTRHHLRPDLYPELSAIDHDTTTE